MIFRFGHAVARLKWILVLISADYLRRVSELAFKDELTAPPIIGDLLHQFETRFKQAPKFHDSAKKLIVLGWLDSYSKGYINIFMWKWIEYIYLSQKQTIIFSSIPSNKNGEIQHKRIEKNCEISIKSSLLTYCQIFRTISKLTS